MRPAPSSISIFAVVGIALVASWLVAVLFGAIRFYLPLNVHLANDFVAQHVIAELAQETGDPGWRRYLALIANVNNSPY